MNNNILDRSSVNYGNIKKIYLECKEDNHYKFYILSKEKDNKEKWLAQWGRIGNRPQSKWYESSKISMYDQYQAKIKKGYQLINSDSFEQAVNQTVNETLEYLRSIGIDVDSLDDILL
jgi:predicted DNA-binding WGR domain protein